MGMGQLEQLLEQTIALNRKYENETEAQADAALLDKIRQFRIKVMVIGKFSTGKSTLLNTFLDYRTPLLAENILPETAVPAEISYGNTEKFYIYPADGTEPPREVSLEEFRKTTFSVENVSKVRLELRHEKLEKVPKVDLVDMPGFDSGYEAHNRILDQYLLDGSAYVLVFSVDEPVLTETMAAILKELLLRKKDVPLCVVLTRVGRRTEEEQGEIADKLARSVQKYYHLPFDMYLTERDVPGSADDLLDFLQELQAQYEELLNMQFHTEVAARVERTVMYLQGRLNSAALSESEWKEQIARLQDEMKRLNDTVDAQKKRFRSSLPQCKALILADVEDVLRRKKSGYVQRLMRGRSIEDKLNEDVRTAVIEGMKEHFEPGLQTYLSQVEAQIQASVHLIADVSGGSAGDPLKTGVGVGVAAGGTAAALASTGTITGLLGTSALTSGLAASLAAGAATIAIPVVGVAIGALAAVLTFVMRKARERERMEDLGRRLESEVFPKIIAELSPSIGNALEDALGKAEAAIDADIQEKQQLLQKALEDARAKQSREEAETEQGTAQLRADLEKMEGIYREYAGA